MQNKSLPEFTGKRWSKDEDAQLLKEIKDGLSSDKISEIHKRTSKGIYYRKKTIATRMYDSGSDKDKITKELLISDMEYEQIINEHKYKNKKRDEKKKEKNQVESISNIEERLDNMDKKMDKILEQFTKLLDIINTQQMEDTTIYE